MKRVKGVAKAAIGLAVAALLVAGSVRLHLRSAASRGQATTEEIRVPPGPEVWSPSGRQGRFLDPAGLGAIAGQVVRADTGAAVKGATVVLAVGGSGNPPKTVTDAQGRYVLEGVPAGEAALVAKAEESGLAPHGCGKIEVQAGATAQARSVKLERGGWVAGRVSLDGPADAAVEWGHVTAQLVEDPVRAVFVSRPLNQDRTFRTSCLPPGRYRLTAVVTTRPPDRATGTPHKWTGEAGDVVVEAGRETGGTTITVRPQSRNRVGPGTARM